MDHGFVASEHILLGLFGVADGVAAGVLDSFGVTMEKIREGVTIVYPPSEKPTPEPEP